MPRIKYRDAIRNTIIEELRKDDDLILIGEDIREGYQGCFGVTTGLCDEFSPERIIDTPISEASIIGTAIGASMLGLKTIAEIMFEDFITVCFDGIVNQAAKLRVLSGGQYNLNMVIRTPGGAGGLGVQHSQCLESIFMHFPGIYIAIPSDAHDAKGLLKTAITYGDPVLFFEHQRLYNLVSEVPEKDYKIEFALDDINTPENDRRYAVFYVDFEGLENPTSKLYYKLYAANGNPADNYNEEQGKGLLITKYLLQRKTGTENKERD